MPDPAGIGRLLKNLDAEDKPEICVMGVNDGRLTAKQLIENSISFDARSAFGPDFSNPKRALLRTSGAQGVGA